MMEYCLEIIKHDYERRLKVNPRYSIRSYAKALGIAVSRLSCILNNKQTISQKTANKIVEKIPMNPYEKEVFLASALSQDKRSKKNRVEGLKKLKKLKSQEQIEIDGDVFSVISDWYHFAFLELMQTNNFKYDISWIASRLNISNFQVQQAIDRLKRLELINENNGSLSYLGTSITTQQDVPSQEIRRFNHQILKMAQDAVDLQTVEERDFSTLTVGIDSKSLPQFKELISKFRSEFNDLAESIPVSDRNEVYMLSTNLFKLTSNKEN